MDFAERWRDNAVSMFSRRKEEALEGFICGFIAEFKCGVVDWQDAGDAGDGGTVRASGGF